MSTRTPSSQPTSHPLVVAGCICVIASLLALFSTSCGTKQREASALATKVESRHQLIGGLNALGKVGDYLLRNDEIQVVVQDNDYNRGSGLFGGSLIDADLVRTEHDGNVTYGGNGQDTFGELFPAFFLEAINPEAVEVVQDGSDGGAAIVEVRGRGGEFVTMLRYINQVMVNSYEAKSVTDLLGEIASDELAPTNSDGRPLAKFRTRYILEPGARHVRIETTIENNSFGKLQFPNKAVLDTIAGFLGLDLGDFSVPTGHVLGFGAANDIFVPGIGYDLRWGLEDAYRQGVELPAFPGKVTRFVATSNPEGISYGFFPGSSVDRNFVCNKDCCQLSGDARQKCFQNSGYPGTPPDDTTLYYDGQTTPRDMLLLFYASGFGGVYTHEIPGTLAPSYCKKGESPQKVCDELLGPCDDESCRKSKQACKDSYEQCLQAQKKHPTSFTFTNYFVVGNGSVSNVVDEMYEVRGRDTTRVQGRVLDRLSGSPVEADVEILVSRPRPNASSPENGCSVEGKGADATEPFEFNQAFTNSEGYFKMRLPPGHYCYRTHKKGRPLGSYQHFKVDESEKFLRMVADSRATIEAYVTTEGGEPMPAKMSVVGTHEYRPDIEKRFFLYDLEAGQSWRTTDLVPDKKNDPSTRRYIEAVDYASADGEIEKRVRPGSYTLSFSRGPEYEQVTREVDLDPGSTARVNVSLKRVIETPDWVSGDFHMHAQGSIDSGLNYTDRVVSIAAEDVEVVVSSDHNYVSDFMPYIQRENLQDWMRSVVGVELTTFEFGHFNAFPLDYQVGSINRGSPKWQRVPPQQIFDELRSRGKLGPDETIIQVNHPRDTILGYFSQFNVDGFQAKSSLEFLEADGGRAKLTAALTMPSGNAFIRDCRPDAIDCTGPCPNGTCDEPRFETKFSWDFDALEIFNGKRMELNRHFRVPYGDHEWPRETGEPLLEAICSERSSCDGSDDPDYTSCCDEPADLVRNACCEDGFQSPTDDACESNGSSRKQCPVWKKQQELLAERYPENAVYCQDGDVAYPGGLDDWYNMLNYKRPYVENRAGVTQKNEGVYHRVTATGNSDSHHAGSPNLTPPGHPRNYFFVGHDNPARVTNQQFVDAMQNHRNIVTNGPFIQLKVIGSNGDVRAGVGQQTRVDQNEVTLQVTVRAAEWVGADRFRIMANGEPVRSLKFDGESVQQDEFGWRSIKLGDDREFQRRYTVEVPRDTWFVLEVEGDDSLFPVYPPIEIPRIPFDEIVGQIAGSFGFGGDIEGLAPDETFQLHPFAFTNPVWVVRDGPGDSDGAFTPPAPEPGKCEDGVYDPRALKSVDAVQERLRVDERLDATNAPIKQPPPEKAPFAIPPGARRDVRTLFKQWGHRH